VTRRPIFDDVLRATTTFGGHEAVVTRSDRGFAVFSPDMSRRYITPELWTHEDR
jgi:hypothetical protein